MSLPTPDPFGMTADPETYMPRAATERALAELERALLAGEFPVVLTGPPGIGKTLLLRVVQRRLTGRVRCIYIAYAALAPTEFCGLILGLLGEPMTTSDDPEAALLASAHSFAEAGTPLALLIDDASAIPRDTAGRIGALAAGSRGALQILAADMEDTTSSPWITRFGARVERVRLEAPMTAAETVLYIRARLQRGGVSPEDQGRLDPKIIDRIFRRSSGIPRAVQALASEFLRVGQGALPTEALETLLNQEDAADLAARVAASARAREVLSVKSTGDTEAALPTRAIAPEVPPASPVPRLLEMRSPLPPQSETPREAFLSRHSPAPAALPTKPAPLAPPQEEVSPPLASLLAKSEPPARPQEEVSPPPAVPLANPVPPPQELASPPEVSVLAKPARVLRPQEPASPPPASALAKPVPGPRAQEATSLAPASVLAKSAPDSRPQEEASPTPASPRAQPAPRLRELASRPPASRSSSSIQPGARRAPVRDTPTGGLRWPRIVIAVLGLGVLIALAAPFLRSVPAVPSPPAPVSDVRSPGSATAPPEAAEPPPRNVTEPAPSPPKPLESPRVALPEPPVPAPTPTVERAPASPPPQAPRIAAVPVVRIPVHINATPWASIEVDGMALGETPIAGVGLAPGAHVFKARMPDGRVIERTVQISAETRYVTFE